MAKKVPQINASSMADISFLLLIFFLVTTSMDVNQGLARRLPAPLPPDQKVEDKDINKRNLLVVKINSANQLMVQGQLMDVKQLRERTKEFIKNEQNADNYPKLVEEDFGAIGFANRIEHVVLGSFKDMTSIQLLEQLPRLVVWLGGGGDSFVH